MTYTPHMSPGEREMGMGSQGGRSLRSRIPLVRRYFHGVALTGSRGRQISLATASPIALHGGAR